MSLLGIRPVSHGRSYKHETAKPTRSRFALIKTTTHSKGSAEFINPALLIHHTCLWARQSNPPICCHSVAQWCPTLCNPMNHSTPGFPVLQHLPIPAQTHVRRVSDATQPSHPLSSPFPPAFNLSQHQGLFQWVSSLHQVAKVLEHHFSISPSSEYSGLISFRIDWFDLLAVQGTLESSATPQFKSINSSALSFLYGPTLTSKHDYWKNHSFDYMDLCWQSNISAL